MKLLLNALVKYLMGIVLVGGLLFLPAWSFKYYHAWLFISLLFIPMLIFGIVLFIKSPELLRKRLKSREKQKTQKGVIRCSLIIFLAGFMIAGFNARYQWSSVPLWLVIGAAVVLLIAYGLYIEVMRENIYLSRIVEVTQNQKVIDTGLYGMVRHPMYFATLLLFLAIPLVLNSFYSLAIFVLFIPVLVIRIINEEKVLTKELAGYVDYKKKVKYRLIPFIW